MLPVISTCFYNGVSRKPRFCGFKADKQSRVAAAAGDMEKYGKKRSPAPPQGAKLDP
jgi:hypothetical protein